MKNYRFLCVDDEQPGLISLERVCKSLNPDNVVYSYSDPFEALAFARSNAFDVALLDVDMPNMNGLTLTDRIMKFKPNTNVILVTAYENFALDAFYSNCSGYLLKPLTTAALSRQLEILRFPVESDSGEPDITVTCFGNFEVLFRGEPVQFQHSMTKELLAFLVDRRGSMCSNKQLNSGLWDDEKDHMPYVKLMKKDLADSFAALTDTELFSTARGFIGLKTECVSCDYYRFLNGENQLYNGEYMEQYSWAGVTRSNLSFRAGLGNG